MLSDAVKKDTASIFKVDSTVKATSVISSKSQNISTRLHGITFQKAIIFIFTPKNPKCHIDCAQNGFYLDTSQYN
jgi:hypothetical protein